MKKLFLLFAAIMMASTTLWAETKNVSYRYPVYNTKDDPASGIKEWKTSECTAIILTTSSDQVTLSEPWYVITGTNVQCVKGIVIQDKVNLILADGAKLTVKGNVNNAGIQVSGEGNSLTIYGQDNQSGQLITTGTSNAAGIGGGAMGNGSNITINGGAITATGGTYAAGIGGGASGHGSNIIINGGKVTANGGTSAAGIGGGKAGNGSNIIINGGTVTAKGGDGDGDAGIGGGRPANIFIAKDCIIKADNNDPPTTAITNTGGDLASSLVGKRYVNIEIDLNVLKDKAIAEINKAIEGVTDEDVHAIAEKAITDINNATSEGDINTIKEKALVDIVKAKAIAEILSASQGIKDTEINSWINAAINDIQRGSQDATPSIDDIKDQILTIIRYFQNGKAEGIADANAALPSDAQDAAGHTVTITKGEKTLKLVNPDKVTFGKQE